ncbi:centromere protein X-like [Euwallacea similis]|uniref:centromere protein X-like n=1 Tax=Euwallacea similis TaxID=1736056 RepID=UPI00344D67EF
MAEEIPLQTKISTTFRHDVIKELLRSKFTNPKSKISVDAIHIITELARTMVIEAAARACYQAQLEEKTVVTLDNVESILVQMMLDFP